MQHTQTISPILLDRTDAADALSITVRKLDMLVARGEIIPTRIDGRVLISRQELERFIASQTPRHEAAYDVAAEAQAQPNNELAVMRRFARVTIAEVTGHGYCDVSAEKLMQAEAGEIQLTDSEVGSIKATLCALMQERTTQLLAGAGWFDPVPVEAIA